MAQHQQEHRIVLISGEEEHEYLLPPEGAGIGRDPTNTIILASGLVSRHHARIEVREDACIIMDLDSANGTYLNEKRLEPNIPIPLKSEDQIRIGEHQLIYHLKFLLGSKGKSQDEADVSVVKERPTQPVRKKAPAAGIQNPPPPKPPLVDSRWAEACRENPLKALGLDLQSLRFMEYLPGIYHTDFMSRYLGLFESITLPVQWTIENFDLFLNVDTSPDGFLPWLEQWYAIFPDHAWQPGQRRRFLQEAAQLYNRRGTPAVLNRMLEIFTDQQGKIDEWIDEEDPFLFRVRLPKEASKLSKESITRIIELNKPAHCHFILTFDL